MLPNVLAARANIDRCTRPTPPLAASTIQWPLRTFHPRRGQASGHVQRCRCTRSERVAQCTALAGGPSANRTASYRPQPGRAPAAIRRPSLRSRHRAAHPPALPCCSCPPAVRIAPAYHGGGARAMGSAPSAVEDGWTTNRLVIAGHLMAGHSWRGTLMAGH